MIPKEKIEEKIYPQIQRIIEEKYNLVISRPSAINIVRKVLQSLDEIEKEKFSKKDNRKYVFKLLSLYLLTTKLEWKDVKNHSCFYFAKFINRNYYIFPVKRNSFIGKILNKFN